MDISVKHLASLLTTKSERLSFFDVFIPATFHLIITRNTIKPAEINGTQILSWIPQIP